MSADLLRARAMTDIAEQIREREVQLGDGQLLPMEQVRVSQGIIGGLKIALAIIDDRYNNLYGSE
jgi:hypothetical protein